MAQCVLCFLLPDLLLNIPATCKVDTGDGTAWINYIVPNSDEMYVSTPYLLSDELLQALTV